MPDSGITDSPALDFRLLGPLEVRRDGQVVRLGGERQRMLLALLLLHANELVRTDELIEALFGDESSDAALNALRVSVSRLRGVLEEGHDGHEVLVTRPGGYLLHVDPSQLDTRRFEQAWSEGRKAFAAGDAGTAAGRLRDAGALWRGSPLADLALAEFAQADIRRLEEIRLAATMDRIDAELALGGGSEFVGELEALVAANPLQERLRGQLMLALYRAGRQAEALDVYRQTTTSLREELGLDPSPALQELERAILIHDDSLDVAARPSPRVEFAEVVTCPFKGLAYFDVADAAYFFGRERLVADLVSRLAAARFVGILGPSGSGKSSLLRAGLLGALAAGALPGSDEWRTIVLRPGPEPSRALGQALAPVDRSERLVVAVDQLEEVFTPGVAEADRELFLRDLADLAEDPDRRIRVAVTLRADFYGRVAPYPEFAALLNRDHVLVGPMSRDEVLSAIERPAERAGLEVERALSAALMADVAGEPGALPLLGAALLELWRRRTGRVLTYDAYVASGGIQGALERLAEEAFGQLDERQQDVARALMLKLSAGDASALVRRRVARAELERIPGAAEVLPTLIDGRVLTAGDGEVEVAHEAVLREWPRFRSWIEEEQADRRLAAHLAASATEWETSNRDPSELYRGPRLAAALEWADAHQAEVGASEHEFIDASQAFAERELRRERVQNRRLRALLAGLGVVTVLALAAGGVALVLRGHARRSATVAEAERLGSQALLQSKLDLSVLLAREGVALDNTLGTRGNLLASLTRAPAAIRVMHGTGDRVQWIDVSPDGRTLAVGDNVGGVVLFDALRFRKLVTLHLPGGAFGHAFSPDSRTLAVGLENQTGPENGSPIAFVDLQTHKVAYRHFDKGWFSNDAFMYSPDGHYLATSEFSFALNKGRIVERDPRTFRIIRYAYRPSLDSVAGPVFSPDGRHLFVGGSLGNKGRTFELDARTMKRERTLDHGGVFDVSPDGRTLAVGNPDGTITLVDLVTGRARRGTGRHTGTITGVRFSPDGRLLGSVGDDENVLIWDVGSGSVRETLSGHSGRVFGPVFSPDGHTLYTSGLDSSVIGWDLLGTRRLGVPVNLPPAPPPPDGSTPSVAPAVSHDGSAIAIGDGSGAVTLVNARTARVVKRIVVAKPSELQQPGGAPINGVDYSPDDTRLAVAVGGEVVVVDAATGRRLVTLRPRAGIVSGVAFDPDGRTFAVATQKGKALVYSSSDGRLVRTVVVDPKAGVRAVAFTPDGRRLVTSTDSGYVTAWNLNGRRLWRRRADRWAVDAIAVSPNGKLVAAGGEQRGEVRFYNASSGHPVGRPIDAVAGFVRGTGFDRSGQVLVTSGTDGTTRLWDVATEEELGAGLPGIQNVNSQARFFPDSEQLLVPYATGRIYIWDLRPASLERRACQVAGRTLTSAERHAFVGSAYVPVCG